MITFSQVREAVQGNQEMYSYIYDYFFGGDKMQGWLVNQGIEGAAERDDLIEELIWAFIKQLRRYKKEHLGFDVYMWVEFNFCFMNFIKRRDKIRGNHEVITEDCSVVFDLGDINGQHIDIEIMGRVLSGNTKIVYEAMAKGLQRQDMEVINLTPKDWDVERINIKNALVKFGYQEEVVN